MATINDSTAFPFVIEAGQSADPFTAITVSGDPIVTPPVQESVSVNLSGGSNPGSLNDPDVPNSTPSANFAETGDVTGNPSPGTSILNRLVYAAPALANGQSEQVTAPITVYTYYYPYNYYYYPYYYGATDNNQPQIDVITPPAISGTAANQPGSANPFGGVSITDTDFNNTAKDSATITITYNGGSATDAVGTLSGNGFLSYTSPGTYTINAESPSQLAADLQKVTLATPPFGSRTVSLELDVTDVLPTSGVTLAPGLKNLTTADTTTSVIETGTAITVTISGTPQVGQVLTASSNDPSAMFQWKSSTDGKTWTNISSATGTTYTVVAADEGNVLRVVASDVYDTDGVGSSPVSINDPPVITGTGPVSVTIGSEVDPFAKVTITDPNSAASDSATISLGASDANGTLSGGTELSSDNGGVYTLNATDPGSLTKELRNLVFTPSGQSSETTTLSLSVNDTNDNQKAGPDNNTVVTTTPSVPTQPEGVLPLGPPNNFLVQDITTGGSWQSQGQAYSGPVAGLNRDIIIATSDNINVTEEAGGPSFIKTGSGEDAIDVSNVNGNNVMDGSTGSNFLTGGTGDDQFYLDDRNAAQPIWSTLVNFHSGDTATIWGITQAGFTLSWADNEGAASAKGLTGTFTGSGTSTAVVTLAGLTTADLSDGKLSISYGRSPDTPGLPGSDYMIIQAN